MHQHKIFLACLFKYEKICELTVEFRMNEKKPKIASDMQRKSCDREFCSFKLLSLVLTVLAYSYFKELGFLDISRQEVVFAMT